MSRAQADEVALAVDDPKVRRLMDDHWRLIQEQRPIPQGWRSDTAKHGIDNLTHYKLNSPSQLQILAKPLSDTFYKNAIASGSIIPPSGEGASVRQTDIKVGIAALFFMALGVVGFLYAILR